VDIGKSFVQELKDLIVRYGYGLPEANQALAILAIEIEEKMKEALLNGKK
jgi:hypothetical protein